MADLLAVGWACLLVAVVGVCFVVWERVEARWIERPAQGSDHCGDVLIRSIHREHATWRHDEASSSRLSHRVLGLGF